MRNDKEIKEQVNIVINLIETKKKIKQHEFLDDLLNRLHKLLEYFGEKEFLKIYRIKGAVRTYFDTNLLDDYNEPLVIELDRLESMLNNQAR
ncbi:hypothetical protein [Aquibacillus rhizosphaerae]|uniref:Uncharacterized protein n=1 Tax=Aquibacillus rhizosphaerae TaxID=3051431 RepID=A0ABT7L8E8_9BACI|nr:hypothetical protein [Aquibacillus sp. LR5S19]MDL4842131.1 hypothetical protein [Aquibacillus sp. LR5S19]